MAIDLFRVINGIDIQKTDLSSHASVLIGSGLPGGDSGQQDGAPIGSMYLRTDAETDGQQVYWKFSISNNSSADWKVAADKAYVDAAIQGLTWLAPAVVLDGTSYVNNTAFPVTGIVDGVSIVNGARVLFTNVTASGQSGVWIWNSATSPHSWTQATAPLEGDAILVTEGTSSNEQWIYTSSNTWVQFGSTSDVAELGYIRTFIGKTGPGSENPSYTSTNVVAQGSNLETAISALDVTFGSGAITNTTSSYALTSSMTWGGGSDTLTLALNQLNNAVGSRTFTDQNVATNGQTVTASIDALDIAVGVLQSQEEVFKATNVTASGTVTVDTLQLTDATEVKWLVQVRENGTPANRRAVEVHAINDGSTLVDFTEYAVLILGSAIAGFALVVDINGTTMRLRLTATNNVDYVVKRIAYSAF